MRYGIRAHDLNASSPEKLCVKLNELGINEIQLVAHKSFPGFHYTEKNVESLARCFSSHGIRISIYGCYIDPLSEEGKNRFFEHMRYAEILVAEAIATESATGISALQNDERTYCNLVSTFKQFAEEGKKYGLKVAVETVAIHPICDPQTTFRLLNDVNSENMFAILDPMNLAQYQGDTCIESRSQEAIDLYGDRILAIHWKNPQLDMSFPAVEFVRQNDKAVLITEGIQNNALTNIVNELKMETKK